MDKEIIPLFNTDVWLYQQIRDDVELLFLTVSDGHVIAHRSSGGPFGVRPEVIGRFASDKDATETLYAAGYVFTAGRFVRPRDPE